MPELRFFKRVTQIIKLGLQVWPIAFNRINLALHRKGKPVLRGVNPVTLGV